MGKSSSYYRLLARVNRSQSTTPHISSAPSEPMPKTPRASRKSKSNSKSS